MIEHSQYIISLIVGDKDIPNRGQIKLARPEEVRFAQEKGVFDGIGKINSFYVLHDVKAGGFKLNNVTHIYFINVSDRFNQKVIDGLLEYGIDKVECGHGMFLALAKGAELKLRADVSDEHLEQYFLWQQDEAEYEGHDLSQIMGIVDDVLVFSINEDSPLNGANEIDVAYFLYCQIESSIRLPITSIRQRFFDLLLPTSLAPKENIFLSYTSVHWKHAFLELYRCVEGLYSFPRAVALKGSLDLKLPAFKVAEACYNDLGWRRKEEDSLTKLFSLLPPQSTELAEVLSIGGNTVDENTDLATKAAEKIYRIRNHLVHQIDSVSFGKLKDSEWLLLINFLLFVIEALYKHYRDDLPEAIN